VLAIIGILGGVVYGLVGSGGKGGDGEKKSIPVNLCGQMSGNPVYTMLLLGMGLRQFSVTPAAIPEIKKVCRSVSIEDCRNVAQHTLMMENARDIRSYLKEELRRQVRELGQ